MYTYVYVCIVMQCNVMFFEKVYVYECKRQCMCMYEFVSTHVCMCMYVFARN